MKRGSFFLLVALVGFLAAEISPAWRGWQYVENEGESTNRGTSYQTNAKSVFKTRGYHLVFFSGEIGINSTSCFAQAEGILRGFNFLRI